MEDILAAMEAIINEAEGRSMTDDEVTNYEKLEGQLKAAQKTQEIRSRQSAYETPVNAGVAAHVSAPKSDDTLERAFDHYLRTGKENQDIQELRAQSLTDAAGGFTVPDTTLAKITETMKAFGGLSTAVETITTSTGEPIRWPTVNDTANAGVIAAEGTAPASGGADLVFGEKVLGAFKYVAPGASQLPLRVSLELLQDSTLDVQSLVIRKLSERIARKQAVDFVSGAGTTLPFGINTGTSSTAFATAGAAPTYANLVAAIHEVDPAYRMNATWCFNDATLAMIESIVDTTGRPILNDANSGISSGAQNKNLLGYPVVIDQAFSTYLDGAVTKFGVFGDLSAGYIIRRVKDVTVIVNPYSRANEGQVEYTMWARADAVPQDTAAYRVLTNAV